jgi:oxygen-independent coproporphyrinogen-3 oxidase
VNRLSVGAQSFDDSALQGLGRIHNSDDIVRTVAAAQAAGFDNINIDLMHALPGQTVDTALADLHAAMALGPQHISWYQLTLEPNTVFHARPPAGLPDNDLAFEIQEQGQAVLRSGRYRQYEVSAYAQAGRRCHHNLNYWLFGDYVAVGAGAHGKLTRDEGVCRYQKPAHPLQYMQTIEAGFSDAALVPLTDAERMFEFMLNGLRLNDGFAEALFRERTGLSTEALDTASADLRRRGLLERVENGVLRPTALGGRFLNDLQAEFLPETP